MGDDETSGSGKKVGKKAELFKDYKHTENVKVYDPDTSQTPPRSMTRPLGKSSSEDE